MELTATEKLAIAERVRANREALDDTREHYLSKLETSSDKTLAEEINRLEVAARKEAKAEREDQEAIETRARAEADQRRADAEKEFEERIKSIVRAELKKGK